MIKNNNKLLKPKGKYDVCGTLWVACDGERAFGPGRMELLQLIDKTGSINKAAKVMGMSYKKAWKMINDLNNQWTEPMVVTQTGGESGGGSALTPSALQLMNYHVNMRQRFLKFLAYEKQNLHNL